MTDRVPFIDPRADEVVTSQRLELDDACLAYGTRGDHGSAVLFLMGLGVAGHAWRNYIVGLAEQHRTVWLDNRGAGATRARPGLYTMQMLADDALRLLDHLGIETAHVIGVSMGGMIAQHVALTAPERLRSLSLLVTTAGGTRARLPQLRGLSALLRKSDAAPDAGPLHRLLYTTDYLANVDNEALRAVMRHDFVPTPLRFWLSQIAAVMGHDTRERLAELAGLPTLVVKAPHDLLVRPDKCEELARRIPGARLVEMPDVGHGLLRQQPQQLLALLRDHIGRVDQSAPSSGDHRG